MLQHIYSVHDVRRVHLHGLSVYVSNNIGILFLYI